MHHRRSDVDDSTAAILLSSAIYRQHGAPNGGRGSCNSVHDDINTAQRRHEGGAVSSVGDMPFGSAGFANTGWLRSSRDGPYTPGGIPTKGLDDVPPNEAAGADNRDSDRLVARRGRCFRHDLMPPVRARATSTSVLTMVSGERPRRNAARACAKAARRSPPRRSR